MDLKNQFLAVTATVAQYQLRLEEYEKRDAAKEREITALSATVSELRQTLSMQEQAALKNEIEILGIPEVANENLHHTLLLTAAKIGVDLSDLEIDWVTRVGPRHRQVSTATESGGTFPRPIVVRLLRRAKKDEVLKAAKVRRNLYANDIVKGSENEIYINERLTKQNRQLFRETRLRTKQHGFQYHWIRNGQIHVRKADKKPSIQIRNLDDLDQHVGPCLPTPTCSLPTYDKPAEPQSGGITAR